MAVLKVEMMVSLSVDVLVEKMVATTAAPWVAWKADHWEMSLVEKMVALLAALTELMRAASMVERLVEVMAVL